MPEFSTEDIIQKLLAQQGAGKFASPVPLDPTAAQQIEEAKSPMGSRSFLGPLGRVVNLLTEGAGHQVKNFMDQGYNPGTQDYRGARNAAEMAVNMGIMASPFKRPPNSLGIFAGENSPKANFDALEVAKRLQKEGQPLDQVILETGWGWGKDGKWRYEIPGASKATIAQDAKIGDLEQGAKMNLPDIFHYPEFYEHVPAAKELQLKPIDNIHKDMNVLGAYRPGTHPIKDPPTMFINTDKFGDLSPFSDFLKNRYIDENRHVIFHEGNHFSQAMHDFAGGANHHLFRDALNYSLEFADKYRNGLNKYVRDQLENAKRYDPNFEANLDRHIEKASRDATDELSKFLYESQAGEIESEASYFRSHLNDAEAAARPWTKDEKIERKYQNTYSVQDLLNYIKKAQTGG